MPTVTVKPSGGDYTSLAAAIAGEAGDLSSIGQLTIECYKGDYGAGGGVNFIAETVNVTGYTNPSSTNYIRITAPVGERHNGAKLSGSDYSGFALTYALTSYVMSISVAYTRVDNLIMVQDRNAASSQYACIINADFVRVEDCIGERTLGSGGGAFAAEHNSGNPVVIRNCLAGGVGIGFRLNRSNKWLLNSTAKDCGTYGVEYLNNSNSPTGSGVINVLATGSGTQDFIYRPTTLTIDHDNCASGDDSLDAIAGNNQRFSQTFTFSSGALLDATDAGAKDYGADLTSHGTWPFSTDYVGTSRPQGSAWDIGWHEVTTSGDALLADDLSTTPTLTEPSIGQTHVLAADDLATTATLTEPALGQVHALLADDLATTPTLTEPSVGQAHALTADDLATTPTLTEPAVGQVHALTADDISTTPTLGEPVLSVGAVVLYAEDLQIVITLPQPQLGQVHALLPAGLSTTPTLTTPALGLVSDAVTPAERVIAVAGQDRTIAIGAEDRVLAIAREDRTIVIH